MPIQVPDTGDWTVLQAIRKEGVRLGAGTCVMSLYMNSPGDRGSIGDIDGFRFVMSLRSRREFLKGGAAGLVGSALAGCARGAAVRRPPEEARIWDLHCHLRDGPPEESLAELMRLADRMGLERLIFLWEAAALKVKEGGLDPAQARAIEFENARRLRGSS